jgi:quercetin dioxygenase-like cupin family protein
MYVHDQTIPRPTDLPGIAHATWGGRAHGLEQLNLWRQSVAPGGGTPPHSHDGEELVLCSAGRGELHIDGEAYAFGADQLLAIPRGKLHQIFNTGPMPMEILGIFAAPPSVFLPDGSTLALPWQS